MDFIAVEGVVGVWRSGGGYDEMDALLGLLE